MEVYRETGRWGRSKSKDPRASTGYVCDSDDDWQHGGIRTSCSDWFRAIDFSCTWRQKENTGPRLPHTGQSSTQGRYTGEMEKGVPRTGLLALPFPPRPSQSKHGAPTRSEAPSWLGVEGVLASLSAERGCNGTDQVGESRINGSPRYAAMSIPVENTESLSRSPPSRVRRLPATEKEQRPGSPARRRRPLIQHPSKKHSQ